MPCKNGPDIRRGIFLPMNYDTFIQQKSHIGGSHGFTPVFMPGAAFDFQRHLITWAVEKGRAAVFADCGMGKTLMELAFAQNVVQKTNLPVLLLTPLAVGHQTVKEAEKFGVDAIRSLDGSHDGARVVVANYERLHLFDPSNFGGVVCDESSILKNFDGVTKKAVTDFMKKHKFRLLCTATAAPNDFIELGTSAEALGYMGYMDMIGKFFKKAEATISRKDENRSGIYRFRGHAERDFWRWICSWSRAIRKPSDLGFDDRSLVLPDLITRQHIVAAESPADGFLFSLPASGLSEQRKERSRTVKERCEKAAECVAAHTDSAVQWCYLNSESSLLVKMTPGAVDVSGNDSDEEKEEKFAAFESGQIRVLVTKPTIAGFGLNWQHCNHQTFFPSHSFEQWYQAVRRSWRFGQKRPVTVDIIASEGERDVMLNLQRKADAADKMFSTLVSLMGQELEVTKHRATQTQTTLPSWI
jgi:hypothetical protein